MGPRMPMMIGFRMVSSKCLAIHMLKTIQLRSILIYIYMITINGRQGSPGHMSCKTYFTIDSDVSLYILYTRGCLEPSWSPVGLNGKNACGWFMLIANIKGQSENGGCLEILRSFRGEMHDLIIFSYSKTMILNYDVIQRSEIHVAKHVGHRNDQLLLVIRPTGLEKKPAVHSTKK